MVADGHTMGISTQVIQHSPRIFKRGFDVNTPFDGVEAGQESIECRLASQMSDLSGKLEFSPLVRLLQCIEKPAPELAANHLERKEELFAAEYPA